MRCLKTYSNIPLKFCFLGISVTYYNVSTKHNTRYPSSKFKYRVLVKLTIEYNDFLGRKILDFNNNNQSLKAAGILNHSSTAITLQFLVFTSAFEYSLLTLLLVVVVAAIFLCVVVLFLMLVWFYYFKFNKMQFLSLNGLLLYQLGRDLMENYRKRMTNVLSIHHSDNCWNFKLMHV